MAPLDTPPTPWLWARSEGGKEERQRQVSAPPSLQVRKMGVQEELVSWGTPQVTQASGELSHHCRDREAGRRALWDTGLTGSLAGLGTAVPHKRQLQMGPHTWPLAQLCPWAPRRVEAASR